MRDTIWQLRYATPDDLDAIMGIETATFTSDAWSRESMAAELANEHARYIVAFDAEQADAVAGYAGLLAPRGGTDGDIQTIAVAETARRRGLGRAMLAHLVDVARRRGVRDLFLEVRADNPPAQHLYHSFGFEKLAVRRGYYQPDNVDAIVMRLRIPEPVTTVAGNEHAAAHASAQTAHDATAHAATASTASGPEARA